jgi:hypothetical protein
MLLFSSCTVRDGHASIKREGLKSSCGEHDGREGVRSPEVRCINMIILVHSYNCKRSDVGWQMLVSRTLLRLLDKSSC